MPDFDKSSETSARSKASETNAEKMDAMLADFNANFVEADTFARNNVKDLNLKQLVRRERELNQQLESQKQYIERLNTHFLKITYGPNTKKLKAGSKDLTAKEFQSITENGSIPPRNESLTLRGKKKSEINDDWRKKVNAALETAHTSVADAEKELVPVVKARTEAEEILQTCRKYYGELADKLNLMSQKAYSVNHRFSLKRARKNMGKNVQSVGNDPKNAFKNNKKTSMAALLLLALGLPIGL